jgi:outer membrane protein
MKSFFALLLASASVYAAAPNVGLVDDQEIFKKYAKAVEMQADIRKSVETADANLAERVKELQKMEADLRETEGRLKSPLASESGKKAVTEELQMKGAAFQKLRAEIQNFANQARGAIQQREAEMNKQIAADARLQAEKVAKAKGLNLVMSKAPILFSDASLDVTEDIIKELNAAYKATAPVTAPAAPAAPVAPVAPAPAAGDKPAAK